MILKLMDCDCTLMDDSQLKGCRIVDGVQEVRLHRLGTDEMALDVQYRVPNRGLDAETFVLSANAYLMNDGGKTIQSFGPAVRYTP